jgi:ParB family chromosome partitioning protein
MTTTRRSALGRGLGALIPEPAPRTAPAPETPAGRAPTSDATEIAVEAIVANPQQPRRVFDEADLRALADSLRLHGVIQPVVVRKRSGEEGRYELVVGERRWRAARLAGLATIPALVKDVASPQLLEVALVENVQRRDLNPIELALAFQGLIETGATQEEVGRRVGLDRSSVANTIRLLDLPRDYQEDVESGVLTAGHAKALLQVSDPERRRGLRDRIVSEGLPVRAVEELARHGTAPGARPARRTGHPRVVDPDLEQLLDSLRQRLQTRVRLIGSGARGRLEIDFYGPEDLDRIAAAILGDA